VPEQAPETTGRQRLNRQKVLRAGVALADKVGIDGFTMRTLAEDLRVVPMALYKHVTGRQDLLAGMVDLLWGEVAEPRSGHGWKAAMRERAVSLRAALIRHRWAIGLMEAHSRPGPHNLRQHNAMMGCLRESGFSFRTTVHVTSTLDAYVYGFALQQQTLSFETPQESAEAAAQTRAGQTDEAAARYPYLLEVVSELAAEGYDFDAEFSVGLELILDAVDHLRNHWRDPAAARGSTSGAHAGTGPAPG
jgi:AcrR family transcriptional regulator